ncbi:MAG: 30S ribosomal protein S3 [Candidatus Omnitrophica bacterium]|nr:30S ribosomal protein S3 [Candidatus Omnitrophota bacterium]
MGQKVHPFLLRIGIIKNWHSRWYAPRQNFAKFILEDEKIRKFIKDKFKQAAVSHIIIERLTEKIRVRIHSARPGIIIGRHGADIERLRQDLSGMVGRELLIDIEEVKNPAVNAQLVAENVALQLEKRIAFRRAMKRAIEQAMNSGAKGIKIATSGRLGGAEMSRRETYRQGKIPLQTLRADIDYGFAEARTTYGAIGVKAWVYMGDIIGKPKAAREGSEDGSNAQESKV